MKPITHPAFAAMVIFAGASLFAADASRPVAPSERVPPGRTGSSARGPLPDPALLDGSKAAAEKKGEFGMIGDFELPGEEDGRKEKAGGAGSAAPDAQQGESSGSGPSGAGGETGQAGARDRVSRVQRVRELRRRARRGRVAHPWPVIPTPRLRG